MPTAAQSALIDEVVPTGTELAVLGRKHPLTLLGTGNSIDLMTAGITPAIDPTKFTLVKLNDRKWELRPLPKPAKIRRFDYSRGIWVEVRR